MPVYAHSRPLLDDRGGWVDRGCPLSRALLTIDRAAPGGRIYVCRPHLRGTLTQQSSLAEQWIVE
jgi:hypothetical protein